MQENVAKMIMITTVFIAIVISVLIIFNAELTPFFDDMSEFITGEPKSSEFNLPNDNTPNS